MDATITLRQYLGRKKPFVIPDYQRGYIWGKRRDDGGKTSVEYLLTDLIRKYRTDSPVFLQGVTVTESSDSITLIDGQQRTTFLYLLFRFLGYDRPFEIRYDIREESGRYLSELSDPRNVSEDLDELYQDRYFFTLTLRLIRETLSAADTAVPEAEYSHFLEYLLDNVRFLYINIPEIQARKVFTMMNGNRARMLPQEIIKAELLRLASRPDAPLDDSRDNRAVYSAEWELNMLRSRYAREWDKWIHWWNRPEIKLLFDTGRQLGWLLTAATPVKTAADVSFESFCEHLLGYDRRQISAKTAFDTLRRVQKRFEDTYNNPITHNKVGAILRVGNDAVSFIRYYFGTPGITNDRLDRYYLCSFLGMTHDEITGDDSRFSERLRAKYNEVLRSLKQPRIYEDENLREQAYRLLLRLNIDEDNNQCDGRGRPFDFSIWYKNVRSLEHIFAKSRVYHRLDDGSWRRGNGECGDPDTEDPAEILYRHDIPPVEDPAPETDTVAGDRPPVLEVTEHAIGNLVLLYKDDNSSFNNRGFNGKKELFLIGEDKKKVFKSRHLLHTIYRFAEADWRGREISENFRNTISDFAATYKPLLDNGQQD